MKTGMEALSGEKKSESKKEEKKPESKGKGKGEAKRTPHEIRTRKLKDGTFVHEHHHVDKHGMPEMQTPEYSSANADDAGAHVAEHMGGDPNAGEADEDEDPNAAAAAGAPPTGGPPAAI